MYIADLHIHSRFSRATSKDCDIPHLDWWAQRKGIQLLGTGDFTHPVWRAELKEQLVPAGEGVYTLKKDLRIPNAVPGETPRFVITGEISSIYKKDGKTRKVHNVIVLPSLEAADELAAKLEAIGNIHSDGGFLSNYKSFCHRQFSPSPFLKDVPLRAHALHRAFSNTPQNEDHLRCLQQCRQALHAHSSYQKNALLVVLTFCLFH